ncbi:MAG TPA: DUF1351 domain-containing protein [Firmicutes bacterium]|nr:DUF1351 domain-containing protein [Bacillota bacterium]
MTGEVNEIIVVKQLPVIEEQLKSIKAQIQDKISKALVMECTEDNVKQIKAMRADLSKDFNFLESRRKEVKNRILAPYEQFERVYKSCVTDLFKEADQQLSNKISSVENHIKIQKTDEIKTYFKEYAANLDIDFITFEDMGLTVNLSTSVKSLKEQAKAFVDGVYESLCLIKSQPEETQAEILVEYKKTKDIAQAIYAVSSRHKAIESERKKAEESKAFDIKRSEAEARIDAVISENKVQPAEEVNADNTTMYEVEFRVRGSLEKLRKLKHYLVEGGYDYEQI